MTHSDIYTKFMIEYDKANITSSYPSLTKYEVATILDKAYLALIAQKYTGNNPRKSAFESDMKATEDLQPLINKFTAIGSLSGDNSYTFNTHTINNLVLYIIDGEIEIKGSVTSHDDIDHQYENIVFVSHDIAKKFRATKTNLPWVEQPVGCIENNNVVIYVDPMDVQYNGAQSKAEFTYIKRPAKFAIGQGLSVTDYDFGQTEFELSDSMAEELINLAIIMSTEIVESSRLATKANTRPLES